MSLFRRSSSTRSVSAAEAVVTTSTFHGPERLLPLILLATATFPLIVAMRRNINWDEFFFLSRIYEYQRGELTQIFQTGYVHLFGWLTAIGSHEVDQILVARGFYVVLLLVSALCLYMIARRFVSKGGAVTACIAFFCLYNVMVHGASFRADGIALLLYMFCLTVILRWETAAAVFLGGFIFGAGVFITVKFVLFALAVGPILLLRTAPGRERMSETIRRLASFGFGGVMGSGLPTFLHARSVADSQSLTTQLADAGDKAIFSAGFFPQPNSALQSLLLSRATWLLIFAGLIYLIVRWSRHRTCRDVLPIILCLPLLSVLFYRNSYPYFYATIVPPTLVLIGIAYDWLKDSLRYGSLAIVVPLTVLLADGLPTLAARSGDTLDRQRTLVEAVHTIFPEPIPYIDGVSMIGAYPKIGFFMSTWGMGNYLSGGRPIFRELVERNEPAFVLANRRYLEVFDHVYPSEGSPGSALLSADREFLRSQFVHHWGPIYVAGVEARLVPEHPFEWSTALPGTYTLKSDAPILLDGVPVESGSTVRLNAGRHKLEASDAPTKASLRWGDNLYRPSVPPPETPIFLGF